jgi:hypothetical protein
MLESPALVLALMPQSAAQRSFCRMAWTSYERLFPTFWIDTEWPHPGCAINAKNDVARVGLTRYIESQRG